MKNLVLVDFDKTLYQKDSLLEYTKFYKGKYIFYKGLIYFLPYFIKWKLGIISNELAKKKFINYFFKNEKYSEFWAKGNEFANHYIQKDINPKIWKIILNHQKKNDDIYIVTASFSEWIMAWSSKNNIKIIATIPEQINDRLTGDFLSKNCYGKEKVNRIKIEIHLKSYDAIYVYGFGKGDYEMLQLKRP